MGFSLRMEHLPLAKESDLKFVYQRYFKKAFLVAAIIHYMAIGAYWGAVKIQESRKVYITRIMTYTELGPPPALTHAAPPTPEVAVAAAAKPVIGIPQPVDDAEVSAEMTIATQTEMSQSIAPVIQDMVEKEIIIEAPKKENIVVEEEALPKPSEFVPYEEPPVPISRPIPDYPEIARKAGIEGMVLLKILVDTRGNVRDVHLLKGLGSGLDEAAMEAAKKAKFTPAIQNTKPVAVWMSYPVRFKLR